jgi:hypothetical protein
MTDFQYPEFEPLVYAKLPPPATEISKWFRKASTRSQKPRSGGIRPMGSYSSQSTGSLLKTASGETPVWRELRQQFQCVFP